MCFSATAADLISIVVQEVHKIWDQVVFETTERVDEE